VAGAAAVFAALAVATLAFALDSSTTTLPNGPEPASVSTPTTVAEVPSSTIQPPPTQSAVVEPADTGNGNRPNGNGHGHGGGHGKGPK
jgi:hypothetical protein